MIICAGRNETFEFATPIGVGLIECTMNLTKLLLKKQPESLLFIGSAGSYGGHKIFDIIHSSCATNIELGFLTDKCYTPLDNKNVPRETIEIVNSSNYITTDMQSSTGFLSLGIGLENMEFFAITSVAKDFNIPAFGIFIVTNYCDLHAHKEFLTNHNKAKELLKNYVKDQGLLKK